MIKRNQPYTPKSKRGVALIAVLWVAAIMGVITMLLSRQSNLSLKINRNVTNATHAMFLAEAGVYRAIGELVLDADTTTSDTRTEKWFDNQSEYVDAVLGDGKYRLVHPHLEEVNAVHYGIMDESAKLNINVATKEQLMQLEYAEEPVIDAILDWRDEDDDPNPLGAESEYYGSLAEPYNAKNGPFDSLDELLLVKGVTLDMLYGEDINQNGALDAPENDGADNFPEDNSDGTLRRGWYSYLTFYSYEENVDANGSERVNLNEADKEEMQSTFGEILEENEIDSIIAARDENNFQSIGDLLDVQLMTQTVGGGNSRNNQGASGTLPKDKVKQIIDQSTVSGDENLTGRINLNTASKTVLDCLFPEKPDVVNHIMAYRDGGGGPFESIGNLLDVDGIDNDTFKQAANFICTKSSVFSVRSIGYLEDASAYKEVYAMIDRGMDPPEIRYWKVIR